MSGWHGQAQERTESMYAMFGTLDVLKLSDWLNACAPCRESKGRHSMRLMRWAKHGRPVGNTNGEK